MWRSNTYEATIITQETRKPTGLLGRKPYLHFLYETTDRDQELRDTLGSCPGLAPITIEQREKLDQELKAENLPLPKTLPTVKTTHH